MAGNGVGRGSPAGTAGPQSSGRPQARRRRQQELRGKQSSAPRPGKRSKDKKKVNCKPKNQDEQEIPFRLREIMRSRQEIKNPVSNKKRKKEAQLAFRCTLEKEAKGIEPDIAIPKFKQRKWESDRAYVQRMEQEAQHVLFLSKNQASRQPEAQVAPKKEKSERKKAKQQFQKRRLDKIRQRKEEKAAERLEQELLQDRVKFGEVALQPPELTAKPRRSIGSDQPGKRFLMLRMLVSPVDTPQPPTTSLARQRIMEVERERVVQAYRELKKQKLQQQGVQPPRPPHLPSERKPETHL
uniref:Coiled-coil domain containing 137 n=1 Tax=Otolemur garnettii TaxID=30611 RepID=H0X457_OTOGA